MVGWIGYGKYQRSQEDPGIGLWALKDILRETNKAHKGQQAYIKNRNKAYFNLGHLLTQ